MLTGEYHHQIDEKGRIRIPVKLKEALGESPVIMRGSNGCLFAFSKEKAEKMFSEDFDSDELADTPRTVALRLIASSAVVVEEDKQGRVLLPQSLIRLAGIVKNIVTVGMFNRVEIWSEERWNEFVSKNSADFDECLKTLRNKP
ncbi:MAG: division/cell wall cluster transcriptional repressor MraZ [Christensenellales bacterium]|jgi:protein mraZ